MSKNVILIVILCLLTQQFIFGATALLEEQKRSIVRIETPEGKLGTGFFIRDPFFSKNIFFLVTNKHLLKSTDSSAYFDSVLIRVNKIENGKVISSHDRATVYLKFKGINYYHEHPDSNIDIAVIALGQILNINGKVAYNPINWTEAYIRRFLTNKLPNREQFDSLSIGDGIDVQLLGFSYQNPGQPQFHLSRFGHVSLNSNQVLPHNFTEIVKGDSATTTVYSEWIFLDIIARGGDSGSPVLAWLPENEFPWIIGIVKGGSPSYEYCVAQPSFYIWDILIPLWVSLEKTTTIDAEADRTIVK